MKSNQIKKIVKDKYSQIARSKCGCSCGCGGVDFSEKISRSFGYSDDELKEVGSANMGLGCGNPVALSKIKSGDTVVDLGSGAGMDCFLAAKKAGPLGQVIGIDMTEEMVKKATQNAKDKRITNVEFKLSDIENLPLEDNSVDVIISNCVINLAPDKSKVFKEAFRVLKSGGKMYVSDIVLLKELPEEIKNSEDLLAGCVSGAILRDDYLAKAKEVGFKVNVLSENKDISKTQYMGIPLESLMMEAEKLD